MAEANEVVCGDGENIFVDRSVEDSKEELCGSVSSRGFRRTDSVSSSVLTSASNWSSFFRSSTFVTLNPWNCYLNCRREKIITVEPILFLYMFGSFMISTLFGQHFFNRYALDSINSTDRDDLIQNGSYCFSASSLAEYTGSNKTVKSVEGSSTLLAVYCSLSYRLLSLVSTLILGPFSDYYGRKLVMVVVSVGMVLQGICALLIVHFNLNLYYFILAYGLAGITGGLPAIMMASFSYISDVSSEKWRTVRIGIAEAMIFISGVVSSPINGWWFKRLDCLMTDPLYLFIACNIINIVFIIVILPPSMMKEQKKMKNRAISGSLIVARGFKILFCAVEKYRRSVWMIWVILIPMLVVVINLLGSGSVNVFFLKDLNWNAVKIGAQVAVSLSSRFVALMFILPILVAVKMPDSLISLIGAIFNAVMNLFMGLSHKTYQIFIVGIVQGMDVLVFPPLRGLMSKLVSSEDQGALFSLVTSVENIGMLIGEVAFPLILPISLEHNMNPGTAYLVMAALGVVPFPFLCVLLAVSCKQRCFKAIKERYNKTIDQQDATSIMEGSVEEASLLSASNNSYYDSSLPQKPLIN